MRIALLYLNALKVGGFPPDARFLAATLAAKGHDVFLVAEEGDRRDGIGEAVVAPPSAARSITARADVVHVWGLLHPRQMKVMIGLADRPIVLSPLCELMPAHLRRSWWKKAPYLAALRVAVGRAADTLHFFSAAEEVSSRWYIHRISFQAGSGIFPSEATHRGPRDEPGDYLLFFGRNDVYQKGLDVLVAGYELACRNGFDLPLVVAGRAHERSDAFWESASPRLRGGLELLGEVSDERKWDLLRGARALVYLSRWDGPPRPIRDALSVGTPLIVTPGTNMAELVTSFGAGVRVELDAASAAEGFARAADARAISGWREGADALAATLTWERVADAYLAGFEATIR